MGPSGPLGPKPAETPELEWQIRNFTKFLWVSGGLYAEMDIHQIDELCWIHDALPLTATGGGGRVADRTDCSQNLDSFSTEWTFPNGSKGYDVVRYIPKTEPEFATSIHGTKCAAQFSGNIHAGTVRIFRDQRHERHSLHPRRENRRPNSSDKRPIRHFRDGGFTARGLVWADCQALQRRHNLGRGTLGVLDFVPGSGRSTYVQRRAMLQTLLPCDAVFGGDTARPVPCGAVVLTPAQRADSHADALAFYQRLRAANRALGCDFFEGVVMKRVDSINRCRCARRLRNFAAGRSFGFSTDRFHPACGFVGASRRMLVK